VTVRDRLNALLDAGLRTSKPRNSGITVMIDKGQMGPNTITDFAAQAADHCDYAKIGWGSALITGNLVDKLERYAASGITPMLGGTLFEYAYLRGKVPELISLVRDLKVHIEVSDGVIDVPHREKLSWIEAFAKVGTVWSEVGGKIIRQNRDWPIVIRQELSAGAKKIVVEGREIGPVGMTKESDVRVEVIEAVLEGAPPEDLVFEAFERRQQVWLIKHLGPNVNLANIPPTDLLTLESFRRGLKEHTLLHTAELVRRREDSTEPAAPARVTPLATGTR
jgi:phosphosulfolactate synthase